MAKKLTPAQAALLKEREGTCIDTYRPMLALVDAELITASDAPYGRKHWIINAEGEKRLAELVA